MKLSGLIALCLITACLGALAGYFIFYFTSSATSSQLHSQEPAHSKSNGTYEQQQAALNGDDKQSKGEPVNENNNDKQITMPDITTDSKIIPEIRPYVPIYNPTIEIKMENFKGVEALSTTEKNRNHPTSEPNRVIVRDYAYTTEKYIAYNNAAVTESVTERDVDVSKSVELTTSQQTSEEDEKRAFNSLLDTVIKQGFGKMIHNLIEDGMTADQKNNEWTALHWAANEDRSDLIKILIENGADFRAKNIRGLCPIHLAAAEGKLDAIKALLDCGDEVNHKDSTNWTALTWSAFNGHDNVVSLLLDLNADIDIKDNFNWTPLDWAFFRSQTKVIEVFKAKYGFDSLLQWTMKNDNKKMLKDLIESEMNDYLKNANWTALHWAINEVRVDVVKALIDDRSYISNSLNDLFLFAMKHWDKREGHDKIIELIINSGADVNCKDKENWTGLHWAVFRGLDAITDMLIKKGADVHCRNGKGQTARELASFRGFNEIVALLDAAEGKSTDSTA